MEDTTIEKFFVSDRERFLDANQFPLTTANERVIVMEGGCQFAFNRSEAAPLSCLDCNQSANDCACERPRICSQEMKAMEFVILDIDRDAEPDKYAPVSARDDEMIGVFEIYLKEDPMTLFFYRTKCSGLRIGIRSATVLCTDEDYRTAARSALERISPAAPGGALARGQLLYPDCGATGNARIFHGYPRANAEIWLDKKDAQQ